MTTKKSKSTTTTDNKRLTDDDQTLLLNHPLHSPAEIKSYVKPAEGMDRITPTFVAFLQAHPEIATALKIDPAAVQSELDDAAQLDGPTARAFNLYRRGYENAMEKRSDVVRAIYKVNRHVQNSDDEELASEFTEVTDWVSKTHAHNTGPHGNEPPAPAPTPAPTKGS
jgi:hypothetical protein